MKNNANRKADKSKTTEAQGPEALREQIQMRAYEIWLTGGGVHGHDREHWLQAEGEILKATVAKSELQ